MQLCPKECGALALASSQQAALLTAAQRQIDEVEDSNADVTSARAGQLDTFIPSVSLRHMPRTEWDALPLWLQIDDSTARLAFSGAAGRAAARTSALQAGDMLQAGSSAEGQVNAIPDKYDGIKSSMAEQARPKLDEAAAAVLPSDALGWCCLRSPNQDAANAADRAMRSSSAGAPGGGTRAKEGSLSRGPLLARVDDAVPSSGSGGTGTPGVGPLLGSRPGSLEYANDVAALRDALWFTFSCEGILVAVTQKKGKKGHGHGHGSGGGTAGGSGSTKGGARGSGTAGGRSVALSLGPPEAMGLGGGNSASFAFGGSGTLDQIDGSSLGADEDAASGAAGRNTGVVCLPHVLGCLAQAAVLDQSWLHGAVAGLGTVVEAASRPLLCRGASRLQFLDLHRRTFDEEWMRGQVAVAAMERGRKARFGPRVQALLAADATALRVVTLGRYGMDSSSSAGLGIIAMGKAVAVAVPSVPRCLFCSLDTQLGGSGGSSGFQDSMEEDDAAITGMTDAVGFLG